MLSRRGSSEHLGRCLRGREHGVAECPLGHPKYWPFRCRGRLSVSDQTATSALSPAAAMYAPSADQATSNASGMPSKLCTHSSPSAPTRGPAGGLPFSFGLRRRLTSNPLLATIYGNSYIRDALARSVTLSQHPGVRAIHLVL